MAEGEEGGDALRVVPAVADKDILTVYLLDGVAGVCEGVEAVCAIVLQTLGEREGEPARGVDIAREDVGYGVTAL